MDINSKYVIAKETLSHLMAATCENGFDPENPLVKQLLEDQKLLGEFDEATINKIVDEYAPLIKNGGNND